MALYIQIFFGILVGGAGFKQLAENPLEGVSALFLAGLLIMTGFERVLFRNPQKSETEPN